MALLDTSFDGDGIVIGPPSDVNANAFDDVAIQEDGKIVAVNDGIIRFLADGSLDFGFNSIPGPADS